VTESEGGPTFVEATQRPRPVINPGEVLDLMPAAETVRTAFAVQVPAAAFVEALEPAERRTLKELTRELRAEQETGELKPGPDERARAEMLADMLDRFPAPDARAKRELKLLAQHVRRAERLPSPAERGVFATVDETSTLEDLAGDLRAVVEESAPRQGGVWWANLTKDEQRELEQLVERVVGAGFFARRRGVEAARLGIDELVRLAETPAPLRSLAEEGAAVLPAGVLADVMAGRLLGVDVGVLAVVMLSFATRRLHPRAEHLVGWTDDGATLVIRAGGLHRLLPEWTDGQQIGFEPVVTRSDAIARRLAAARWLVVDKGVNEVRVRLGPRLLQTGKAKRKLPARS
jgi:hypothetical protein